MSQRTELSIFLFAIGMVLAGCGASSGTHCEPSATPQNADSFCAPQRAAAGQPLRLQIREQCGGCAKAADHCEVVVTGQSVKLKLLGNVCTLSPDQSCAPFCVTKVFDCTVPPLTAGNYSVSTEAGSAMTVTMTADPTVATTACSIP